MGFGYDCTYLFTGQIWIWITNLGAGLDRARGRRKQHLMIFVKGMIDAIYISMTIVQRQENELRRCFDYDVHFCSVKGVSLVQR
jgi:hypothetical protein